MGRMENPRQRPRAASQIQKEDRVDTEVCARPPETTALERPHQFAAAETQDG